MKNKEHSIFTGVCTALITPFSDGKIDYFALKRLIEFQIKGGVDALLVCGTTGESATLSECEKRGETVNVSMELPKSFVLTSQKGKNTVYFSQLSVKTLCQRADDFKASME
jgi:4-hydroxy-tetrahydrodipicolinate synthase